MRIGVDATSWANGRGYGRFTREVLRAVTELPEIQRGDHELLFFIEEESVGELDLSGPQVRVRPVALSEAPSIAAAAEGHRSLMDLLRLARAVRAEPLDAFFSPTVYTYFPLPRRLPVCVCVHDAIAERFPELTVPSLRARLFWNAKVRFALRQAGIVLTVSEYSRRDLERVLGVPAEKIRVAVEAPSATFRPSENAGQVARAARAAGLPDGARWLVYVGGFNPHKNVDLLVRAHAALAESDPSLHLLLVGAVDGDVFHGDTGRIRQVAKELGTEDRVHWCGFVPDEELRHLHTGAVALVLPSMCEGFGLPAVEAAACGAPVVATTESPLPELLEGGGLFVEPGRTEPLVEALSTLLGDEQARLRMGARARERTSELSWPRAARATLDAITEAAGSA